MGKGAVRLPKILVLAYRPVADGGAADARLDGADGDLALEAREQPGRREQADGLFEQASFCNWADSSPPFPPAVAGRLLLSAPTAAIE